MKIYFVISNFNQTKYLGEFHNYIDEPTSDINLAGRFPTKQAAIDFLENPEHVGSNGTNILIKLGLTYINEVVLFTFSLNTKVNIPHETN